MQAAARSRRLAPAVVALALGAAGPVSAAAADFTWSGRAPQSDGAYPFWSDATNWVGGIVPSSAVGRLTFPLLTGDCSSSQPSDACYLGSNDLVGLNAQAVRIDVGAGYSLSGNAITLGAGGLTAMSALRRCPCGVTTLSLPMLLSANQTWSVDGGEIPGFLGLSGKVTGAPYSLQITAAHQAAVNLSTIEVGAVTITGLGSKDPYRTAIVTLGNPGVSTGDINGVDANSVRISHVLLFTSGAATGALSTDGAVIVGGSSPPPGKLSVHGGVTLDKRSELVAEFTHSGNSPGHDYFQLHATGIVMLGGAHLALSVSNAKGYGPNQPCPKLRRGMVATLISTPRSIRGRFAGVRDGAKVTIACARKRPPLARIYYRAHTVTAVVQSRPRGETRAHGATRGSL